MKKFFNPLINDFADIDDPEFGLESLENVDMQKSFDPEIIQQYEQSLPPELQPGMDDFKLEAIKKLRQMKQPKQEEKETPVSTNPFGAPNMNAFGVEAPTSPFGEKGTLTDADKERASEPSKVGEGFERRPSMKPIWDAREARKRDKVNIEALKKFLSGK
jgi:hypothetical protein